MNFDSYFRKEQLFWLEDLSPELFVKIKILPKGKIDLMNDPILIDLTIRLENISRLVQKYSDNNIWRSWNIYRDYKLKDKVGPIPLIFDIDDEEEPPNLKNAYELTSACINELEDQIDCQKSDDRIRVVFSGRKGFHIEVKPLKPCDGQEIRKQLINSCIDRGIPQPDDNRCSNIFFLKTVFDPLYHNLYNEQFIRITNSVYSWKYQNKICSRKVFQMSVEEFRNFGYKNILKMAQAC